MKIFVKTAEAVFRRFSILFTALAGAPDERLHAAADRLAAEAEQRKAVQLKIGRHPVRIGRTDRLTLCDTSIAPLVRMVPP